MSPTISIMFENNISLNQWMNFCQDNDITFSPMSFGQNIFHRKGIEITLNKPGTLPLMADNEANYSFAKPPELFNGLLINLSFSSDVSLMVDIFDSITGKFGGNYTTSPGMQTILEGLGYAV